MLRLSMHSPVQCRTAVHGVACKQHLELLRCDARHLHCVRVSRVCRPQHTQVLHHLAGQQRVCMVELAVCSGGDLCPDS